MKTRILSLSLFIFSISAITYSQTSGKSVESAEMKDSVLNVFSSWNGARIVRPVTIGTETSGFFYSMEYPWVETYGVSLALFKGSSFSLDKGNGGFAKYSPLYHTFNEKPGDFKFSDTFIQYAPGISLFSMNRKFSLDLYKKLNNQIFIDGYQQMAPLKVNFHF